MEIQNKKCSSNKHEINAISYCDLCKIYMCNKCSNLHSELFQNHQAINLNKEMCNIFTGFCKEAAHRDILSYFCKTHNTLCCAACISKIKSKGNGLHQDCEVCNIEEIKDEKKNNIEENIKCLEDLSKSLDKFIKELKIVSEEMYKNKEDIKLKIQKIFTKIRSALNEREDKLLSEVDENYNEIFIKDEIIKESNKLPNKIKASLEKANLIDKDWNDDNKLSLCINECLNIENNIKYINEINDKIKQSQNYNEINIDFSFDQKFIEKIETFGYIAHYFNIFKDSLILNGNQKYIENLKNWINDKKKFKTKLLYRKTRDGDSYANFHKLCDNQGANLVIIKTTEGNIIGGYTSLDWDDHSDWKNDKDTFLFSLNDNKIFKKINNKNSSIYCNKDAGAWFPFFGFYKYNGRTNLTQGQILSSNYFENYNLLLNNNGKTKYFDAEEVEVFKII